MVIRTNEFVVATRWTGLGNGDLARILGSEIPVLAQANQQEPWDFFQTKPGAESAGSYGARVGSPPSPEQ